MTPIQLILTGFLFAFLAVCFGRIRSRLLPRIVLLASALFGLLLILMPDVSSHLAHAAGVGRGVDLVLYCGLSSLGFISILLYSRCRNLESRLTELARAIAILDARSGPDVVQGAEPTITPLAAPSVRRAA
jgi:hypothetical protein